MTELRMQRPEDTFEFGRRLGSLLRAGDVVILSGALGAGKTLLTKGIGAGMAVTGTVSSPTFVIARVHRPQPPATVRLVHVDAYRLAGALELDDLDLDTDLDSAAVVVEWGAGVAERLSDAYLLIELDRHPDDTRTATLTAQGGDWAVRIEGLGKWCPAEPQAAEPGT